MTLERWFVVGVVVVCSIILLFMTHESRVHRNNMSALHRARVDSLELALEKSRDTVKRLRQIEDSLRKQEDSAQRRRLVTRTVYAQARDSALRDTAPTPATVESVVQSADAEIAACDAQLSICQMQRQNLQAQVSEMGKQYALFQDQSNSRIADAEARYATERSKVGVQRLVIVSQFVLILLLVL